MNFINSILLFFAVLLLGPTVLSTTQLKEATAVQIAAKNIDPFQDMALVRGGTYTIGMNTEENEMRQWNNPYRRVTVSSFKIDKYEVSNKKYRDYTHWLEKLGKGYENLVKEALPDTLVWREPLSYNEPMVQGYFRAKAYNDYPVVGVSWVQANNYCRWRTDRANEKTLFRYGLIADPKTTPYMGKLNAATNAQSGTASGTAATSTPPPTAKKIKSDEEYIVVPEFRLPTEAEWEYACRAGTSTAYSFGDESSLLSEYAWYENNSGEKYQKVGTKQPNPWGLFDMHGNVAEWTLDQYIPSAYLSRSKGVKNPLEKVTKEYPKTVRGGSWMDPPGRLRSAARRPSSKNWKKRDPQIPKSKWWHTDAPFVGFRVVRPLETPSPDEQKNYWNYESNE